MKILTKQIKSGIFYATFITREEDLVLLHPYEMFEDHNMENKFFICNVQDSIELPF